MTQLEVIGGGKMGTALAAGLLAARWCAPDDLRVVEALPARREALVDELAGVEIADRSAAADAVIVAVKPGDVEAACKAAGAAGSPARLLSVAAGITIPQIETALAQPSTAVIRVMPNTPALVGEGASAIAPGSTATDDDMTWAESILGTVGSVVRVAENQMDAVTGLSGSGPAYVFLVAEAMIEAGVLNGLSRDVSERLAIQTLVGASQLLAAGGRDAGQLRADVTSPGGTTAAGLRALEDRAVRAAFLAAVSDARARSAELGS